MENKNNNIKVNSINNLSALTKLPARVLNTIIIKINAGISSIINEAIDSGEKKVKIDLDLGILAVDIETMQCEFIPGETLKSQAKFNIERGIDVLDKQLERELKDRLIELCKESL